MDADGQAVVFESTRDEEGVTRLHRVKADGNGALAEALPLPQAFQGSFSPTGNLSLTPRAGFGEWRYYRAARRRPSTSPICKRARLKKRRIKITTTVSDVARR
jgi:hypothetical protein